MFLNPAVSIVHRDVFRSRPFKFVGLEFVLDSDFKNNLVQSLERKRHNDGRKIRQNTHIYKFCLLIGCFQLGHDLNKVFSTTPSRGQGGCCKQKYSFQQKELATVMI